MPSINVQQLIDGLYIAFYNRAGDNPGYLYWESQVNLTQAQATSTVVQNQDYTYASPLGEEFFSTQSTYFNNAYSGLANSDFINQIYINFGGNAADANGLNYWVNLLSTLSREQVALRIAQDFLTINLSLDTALSPAELAAAQIRQQTFYNKISVSESFAAASVNNSFLVATTASSTNAAFKAAIDIVQGITSAGSTVTTAQNLINSAVTAGNVQPILAANAPSVSSPGITVAENATATAIGIAAPTDPNATAAQLTITVGTLPSDGTVSLANGTAVTAGQVLTSAQLTGLLFTPTTGTFSTSSTFTYSVTDPLSNASTGTATLAIGPANIPPTVSSPSITVAENGPATAIGIAAPSDANYTTAQLTITAGTLPSDGTVTLANGTAVTAGQALTIAQLTGLLFQPTTGKFGLSSAFTYSVTDPANNTSTGTATVAIGPAIPITYTLTLGSDAITGSGVGSDVINAPLVFNSATASQLTTLQTGDTISESGPSNTLNLTVGAADKTISGATISGVQTINVTNSGYVGAAPILQGAGVTGVTTVNNVAASTQAVTVGSAASPLATALTSAGVQGTTATSNTNATTVVIATTALAGTSDALTVNASNAGTISAPARVLVGPATGTNGYETVTVAAAGTDFIGIGNPLSGANTTSQLTVTGAGTVSIFGDGFANDFTKLATIDASAPAMTGAVTLTGAATAGSAAGAGLLTGDLALKSVKTGPGNDVVDLSSLPLSQLLANTTTVDLGAGVNTLIVDNSVATTANALTGIANVQVLGDANPGATSSTVDFSKLPSSVNDFSLFGAQGANNIALINGPNPLTFEANTFGALFGTTTIAAAGTGTADVLNLLEGSATAGNTNDEYYALTGYETVNVTSKGGPNTLYQIKASASAGGAETLNIGGTAALTILGPVTGSAVVLAGNNTVINITNTGVTTLATTSNTGSTNAQTINAQMSGGLIMGGAETGNVLTAGQSINGSLSARNILIGSPGNDAITGGSAGDVINTDGGADTINLQATHVTSHIELYGVNDNATVQSPGAVQGAAAGSIVNANDQAGPGFWGQAPAATPISIFTLFPGTTGSTATFGTSADQANVMGFIAGPTGDSIDISLSSFTAATGAHKGLVGVDGATPAASSSTGTAVQEVTVTSGSVLTGTSSDLIVISGAQFSGAAALAAALKSGSFGLTLAASTVANNITHQLFGYNDSSGNAHIADVAVKQSGTSLTYAGQLNVAASDMVQLTSVSISSIVPNNVHIVS